MCVAVLLTKPQHEQWKSLMTRAGFTSESPENNHNFISWMLNIVDERVTQLSKSASSRNDVKKHLDVKHAEININSVNQSNYYGGSKHYHQFQVIRRAASTNSELLNEDGTSLVKTSKINEPNSQQIRHISYKENVKCPLCQTSITRLNIRKHLRMKHKVNPNDYNTKDLKNIISQAESKNEECSKYRCDICNKAFKLKSSVKRHMRQMHEGKWLANNLHASEERTFLFCCEICRTYFKCVFYLLEHNNVVHKQKGKSFCLKCSTTFTSRQELKLHGCYTPELLCSCVHCVKFGNYECTICGKTYRIRSQLKEHRRSSHKYDRDRFLCTECDETFRYKSALLVHETAAHGSTKIGSMKKKEAGTTGQSRVESVIARAGASLTAPLATVGNNLVSVIQSPSAMTHHPQHSALDQQCGRQTAFINPDPAHQTTLLDQQELNANCRDIQQQPVVGQQYQSERHEVNQQQVAVDQLYQNQQQVAVDQLYQQQIILNQLNQRSTIIGSLGEEPDQMNQLEYYSLFGQYHDIYVQRDQVINSTCHHQNTDLGVYRSNVNCQCSQLGGGQRLHNPLPSDQQQSTAEQSIPICQDFHEHPVHRVTEEQHEEYKVNVDCDKIMPQFDYGAHSSQARLNFLPPAFDEHCSMAVVEGVQGGPTIAAPDEYDSLQPVHYHTEGAFCRQQTDEEELLVFPMSVISTPI